MRVRRRAARLSIASVLALVLAATFSAVNAGAAIWEFNGTTLTGEETVLASASKVTLTIPGLTTTCDMDYDLTIWNAPAGAGAKASATGLSFSNCHTDSQSCTVAAIQALGLPWVADPTKVSASIYLVIKGVLIDLLYAGEECVLAEVPIEITGSAGGLIDNATESVIFNSSSFKATGTKLSGLKTTIQLQGIFAMQATGAHSGQSIAVL
jgi:hypothetical protein